VRRQRRCAEAIADCGFEAVMFSDDISGNMGLFISPDLFRELVIPTYRRILEPLVQAGVKIIFHSDGIITPCSTTSSLRDLRLSVDRIRAERLTQHHCPLRRPPIAVGNVNCDVVHAGPVDELPRLVAECLQAAAGFPVM